MGADFAKLPFVEGEDAVGVLDGGQSMCDGDGGASAEQAFLGVANEEFGVGFDAGGGFVEDQDFGFVDQGAGEADELFLAGGEVGAAFEDGFLETPGQCFDEVEQVDLSGGGG